MNKFLPNFRKPNQVIANIAGSFLVFMVVLVAMLYSQDAKAQLPYKGSELFVYNMVGKPPFANRTPACMKFVSFTSPGLYCPPPPPSPDPPSGGGGGGQSDQGGGFAFNKFLEPKSAFAPPPSGGVFDAFDNDIIGLSFYSTNGSCYWTSNAATLTVCPVAGSSTIINGFFFEYGVSMTGGGAATISTPTLRVLVNGVQVYTKTFATSDRYNGFYAAFPASLNTTSWEGKNVSFEVTDVREHIIDDFAIIGTNNCSNNRVCLGNLVWEDSNNNGMYDNGEPKKANVKLQVFRDDGDGIFEIPTKDYLFEDNKDGLIAETTTDANGNYNVCLPAGSYFVRVSPENFSSGGALFGCFPTIGPSVTGNSDQDNKDHTDATLKAAYKGIGMLSTIVTLTVGGEPTSDGDDANTNSTIDFGISCDQSLLMNLGNLVWDDSVKVDGLKGTTEKVMPNVLLELYVDVNNNGTYDASDVYAGSTTTSAVGIYNFTGLVPGNYIVKAPASNFKWSPAGALRGYYPSPGKDPATDPDDNIDNDDNGILTSSNDLVTRAVTLASGTEPTTDGDGSNGNLTLDLAVIKDPRCTEYYSFGRGFTYDYNGNTIYHLIGNVYNDDFSVRSSFDFVMPADGEYTVVYDKTKSRFMVRKYNVGVFALYFDANGNPSSTSLSTTLIPHDRDYFGAVDPTNGIFYRVSRGYYPDPEIYSLVAMVPPSYNEVIVGSPFGPSGGGPINGYYQLAFGDNGDFYSMVSPIDYLFNYNTVISKLSGNSVITSVSVAGGSQSIVVHDASNSVFVSNGSQILRWPKDLSGTPTVVAGGGGAMAFGSAKNELVVLSSTGTSLTSYTILSNGNLAYNKTAPANSVNNDRLFAIPCAGGTGTPPPPTPAPLKLGNRVWNDVNNDGINQSTEVGIANVGVVLYKDSNNDGIFDRLTDLKVDSTTTNATGYYLFDNLLKGDYFVLIPNNNFLAGKALNGKYSSTPTVADPNTDVDLDDNGINPVMPRSHVNDGVASGKITLSYGTEPPTAVDGDDNNGNMTIDFGFYAPLPGVDNILRLGNRVWEDANNNIKIDTGEKFFDGVKLTLLKDDGDLLFNAATDLVVATTTTAGGGFYLFDKLLPGNYFVRVDKENFDAGQVLDKFRSSTGYYGANTCFDSTDKGNEAAFNWWIDGILCSYISLELNEEPPVSVDGDDQNGNMVIDFGFYRPVRLGNRVWLDTNKDGKRDASEPDINGVLVNAYLDNGDGIFNLNQDTYVGMRTTQDSGYYNFGDLISGKYFVQIPSINFVTGAVLEGLTSSPGVVGENPPANNTDHGIDNADPLNGGILSQIVDLEYDTEPDVAIDTDNKDGNFTIDFGFGTTGCYISTITATPGPCVPATNKYTLDGIITFNDPPSIGNLTVQIAGGGSQVFNAPFTSPQAYSITGQTSDGASRTVVATFSVDNACTKSITYTAPVNCTPLTCSVSLTATPGACVIATNKYTLTGSLTFTNPPATGTLTVQITGGGSQVFNAPFTSPQAYSIAAQTSDGASHKVTATFSADNACTNSTTYTAPVNCSPLPCSVSLTAVAGACVPATNQYTLTGSLTFSNAPSTGTLTVQITGGGSQVFNAPFTSPQAYSIAAQTSDGASHTVTAIFSADNACTNSTTYTAPVNCAPLPCSVSLTATPSLCIPATNQYTLTGSITFSNAPSTGTLTVQITGGGSQVFNAPFTSPQAYSITGQTSDGASRTVVATFSVDNACTKSITYTAPVNCLCALTITPTQPVDCDNAGTFTPTDDKIKFSLNVTSTNGGTGYTITASTGTITPNSGTYNNPTQFSMQAGSVGAGDVTITVTDNVTGACKQTAVIVDPKVCSVGNLCLIDASGLANLLCHNGNTTNTAVDDYVSFSLNPTGLGLATNYLISIVSGGGSITPTVANYGAPTSFQFNVGSASQKYKIIRITDTGNNACYLDIKVDSPGTCSGCLNPPCVPINVIKN